MKLAILAALALVAFATPTVDENTDVTFAGWPAPDLVAEIAVDVDTDEVTAERSVNTAAPIDSLALLDDVNVDVKVANFPDQTKPDQAQPDKAKPDQADDKYARTRVKVFNGRFRGRCRRIFGCG